MDGSGDADGGTFSAGQTARDGHGVAPEVVEELATADHTADHGTGIDAHGERESGVLVAVEETDDAHHLLRELDDAARVVGAVHGQSAHGEIGTADGFDFLDAGFFRRFIEGGDEIAEHAERFAFTGAGAEFFHADDFGEEDADIGELAVRFLVALAALGHGGGGKDAVEQLLVFMHLALEVLFLRLDAGRHVIEDGGELAEFVLRFHVDAHISLARAEAAGSLGEASERTGEEIGHGKRDESDNPGQSRGGDDHATGEGAHRRFGFGQIHLGEHTPA